MAAKKATELAAVRTAIAGYDFPRGAEIKRGQVREHGITYFVRALVAGQMTKLAKVRYNPADNTARIEEDYRDNISQEKLAEARQWASDTEQQLRDSGNVAEDSTEGAWERAKGWAEDLNPFGGSDMGDGMAYQVEPLEPAYGEEPRSMDETFAEAQRLLNLP